VLPGLMIDSREEDRSRRDGVVDATMYLIAFALSGVVLADTWTLHPSWLRVVDLVIGVATLTALHWRRSHPTAVGIFTAAASIVMIAATGPALVGAFNAAIRARGLPLAFVAADEPLPAALGRTAYRIVQEGLTNARKHAPGAAVDVALTRTGDSLTVQVRSRPPVGVAAAVLPGAGTGLIGLAERVSLAGGELEHGLDAAGAFFLRARLPYST
jgi:hypothetical protein